MDIDEPIIKEVIIEEKLGGNNKDGIGKNTNDASVNDNTNIGV